MNEVGKIIGTLLILFNDVQHKTQSRFFSNTGQLGKGINGLFNYFRAVFQDDKNTKIRFRNGINFTNNLSLIRGV